MKKNDIYLLKTSGQDKVWIGKDELFSSIQIGIQFDDGRLWSGEGIFKIGRDIDEYCQEVWKIATLFSKVYSDINPIQGNFALDACISAVKEKKLPYEKERVKKLAEYVLNLEEKIREALETPMPQEYIDNCKKILRKDHGMIEPEPDMID